MCVITDKMAARTGTATGRTVRVNGKPFRVVGVVKAVSAFLEDATADIYLPYMVEGMDLYPNNRNPLRHGDNYVDVTYEGNLNARIMLREGFTLKDFDAEMGIRKAFGAKRRTLLNEVISENLVLTLLGGIVGWVLSALFVSAISDNQIFLQMFVSADQSVVDTGMQFQMFFTPTLFLIVFLCCVLLNLMAALMPAWHSLRKPIVESLNQKR